MGSLMDGEKRMVEHEISKYFIRALYTHHNIQKLKDSCMKIIYFLNVVIF